MKSEQLRLYNHYTKLGKENYGKIGENAIKNAKEILKSFPEFEKVEEVKKEKKAVKNDVAK